MHTLAIYYHSINEEEKYIEFLKKSSDRGHAMALALLGAEYFTGTRLGEKDNVKGFILMREAALRGYVDAQALLGIMLLDNFKEFRDGNLGKEGRYWVRKAAENGRLEAIEYMRNHREMFEGE